MIAFRDERQLAPKLLPHVATCGYVNYARG